jgi:catechol 2,3-dioxygenase-like lactoylglutathione lyase family enzyme
MLREFQVMTMIRCGDVNKQRSFYGEVLGLREVERLDSGETIFEAASGSRIGLYPGERSKADHTLAAFKVRNIAAVITALKAKGVAFESYDTPTFKTVDHVATAGQSKCAWFRDTEGNFLALSENE